MNEQLCKKLRQVAEWFGPNNDDLPIEVYKVLLEAADVIEKQDEQLNDWMKYAPYLASHNVLIKENA